MRSRRPRTGAARAGARDVPDHTRRARRGERREHARDRVGAEARECPGETPPSDPGPRASGRRSRVPRWSLAGASSRSPLAPGRPRPRGHGVPPPPDLATFVFGWSFDPLAWLPAIVALLLWRIGVGRVNRAHPDHPGRRGGGRSTGSSGVIAILFAVDSGLALLRHDAVLAAHGPAPAADARRAAAAAAWPARSRSCSRRPRPRRAGATSCPVLHSRVLRALSFPVVAWVLFAAVHVGEPLLAAVRPRPREPLGPPLSSTCCS